MGAAGDRDLFDRTDGLMRAFRLPEILRLRTRSIFSRARVERELDEELQYHIDRQIEQGVAAGMSQEEARHQAFRGIEGFEQKKEECRDMWGLNFIDNAGQDLRFTLRQLRKNAGFTATAFVMLALGLCAGVAIFAFVDAALLKPLPYRDPARLVGVYESVSLVPQNNLSYLDYLDWKRLNGSLSALEAYQHNGFIMSTATGVQPVLAARVSDGFFRALGVVPALGRDFYKGEDLPGKPRTALLSYSTWQNRFGGTPDIIGKTLTLDGKPNVVIGVLPRGFHFAPAEPAEIWTALHASGPCGDRRSCHNLYGIGRLKDGVSLETALSNLKLVARQLEKQYPDSNMGAGASVLPLAEVIAGKFRPLLLVLLAGAGLLLLIAWVNVATLLLARSEARRRELAVRGALGASRWRLVRQFVTETVVLIAASSCAGLATAYWLMHLLTRLIPAGMLAGMPYLTELGANWRVLTFAASISLIGALLLAAAPIAHFSFSKIQMGLAEGSRGSAGNAWRRIGSKLVILELATAMVLLVGAGLLGKSFYYLLNVHLGLNPSHLATMEIAAPMTTYSTPAKQVLLARKLLAGFSELPGVESAGLSSLLPVEYNGNTDWIRFPGRPYHGEHNEINERDVSVDYFATIGAKLLRGRSFTEGEDGAKPRVLIINQALARLYYPGQNPIGQQFGDDALSPSSMRTIVGIVEDIREGPLDSTIWPAEYLPFNQSPDVYFSAVVRTSQSEQSVIPSLAACVRGIDPGIVTFRGAAMRELISDSQSAYLHRSSAWLVGGFAILALLLGVVGLYGVVAYSVSQRTREIGVRMALGAERGSVYKLILKEAGRLTLAGIALGLACAVAAAALIRNLLFGVESWDLSTLAAVAAILGVSALLASYVPARRAASVNPVEALRAE